MKKIIRQHIYFGLFSIILGMCLGVYMALSRDHTYNPVHSHINLIGSVISIIYAFILTTIPNASLKAAAAQCWLHQIGVIFFIGGLFLLINGVAASITFSLLLIGALLLAIAVVILIVIFYQSH